MKTTRLILLTMFVIHLFSACKKETDEQTGEQTYVPAYIAPTASGYIQASANTLTLQPGQQANLSAQLFKTNGTLNPVQPTFQWSIDNASVGSVSSGVVTAAAEGDAVIAVTDGTHGFAYVHLKVVGSSSLIPSGAASIVFTPPVVQLNKGETKSFGYQLKSHNGQNVGGVPGFFVNNPGSGIAVTASSITAGQTTGNFYVQAYIGNDTFSSALLVIVTDPAQNNSSNPNVSFRIINAPINFNNIDLTANAIRIEVTESYTDNNGNQTVNIFQTSPESVSIAQGGIVAMDGSGKMKSIGFGAASYKIKYKDKEEGLFVKVNFPIAGNWGNSTVNVCISYPGYSNNYIGYYNGSIAFNASSNVVNIEYYFTGCPEKKNFQSNLHLYLYSSNSGKSINGPLGQYPTKGFEMYKDNDMKNCNGNQTKTGRLKFFDYNTLELDYGGTSYKLNRNQGSCVPLSTPHVNISGTMYLLSEIVADDYGFGLDGDMDCWYTEGYGSGSNLNDLSYVITYTKDGTQNNGFGVNSRSFLNSEIEDPDICPPLGKVFIGLHSDDFDMGYMSKSGSATYINNWLYFNGTFIDDDQKTVVISGYLKVK